MIKQKLKLQVPRWLGSAAAAALLATSAHAQSYEVANITASGIYNGGNTVVGGIPFTNGAAISQQFSLYFDIATGNFDPSATAANGTATETITIGTTPYSYSFSSVGLAYGHNPTHTEFDLFAGGSDPLNFGFYILENANPAGGIGGNTLNISDLSPILSIFQTAVNNGNSSGLLDMDNTYIYGNNQDQMGQHSTFGSVGAVPEPSTLALTGLSSLSLLLFRRRK